MAFMFTENWRHGTCGQTDSHGQINWVQRLMRGSHNEHSSSLI